MDWLLNHVEGFVERREARKFASMMLKKGLIRHTVNKLTFSEQCYYVFGEIVSSLAAMRIRDEDKESEMSEGCGPLPPPSAASQSQGCWSNPYSSSTLTNQPPLYAPMPYMTGGYESNAYSYPQEPSHSGSGGSGSRTMSSVMKYLCEGVRVLRASSSGSVLQAGVVMTRRVRGGNVSSS